MPHKITVHLEHQRLKVQHLEMQLVLFQQQIELAQMKIQGIGQMLGQERLTLLVLEKEHAKNPAPLVAAPPVELPQPQGPEVRPLAPLGEPT